MRRLSYDEYRDRVLAGWLGKCIGGALGAPLENHKRFGDRTLGNIWPAELVPNDDLDIQLVWLEAMQERGVFLSHADLVEFWQDRCWYNFCEYGFFLNNVQRGIAPPLSGQWNNAFFRESEGCPIRSEIWGFVSPGNASLAAELATMDAQLDHCGESVEAERFNAAAASEALVSGSIYRALEAGLSVISPGSRTAEAVHIVRRICREHRRHVDAWRLVIREFGDRDASKAITNHAIVLMALLLGEGDFASTMLLAVNSGWDTDCTAATAGALLGAAGGVRSIPSDWIERIGTKLLCAIEVKHQHSTIEELAEDTCRIGSEMASARNAMIDLFGAPPPPQRAIKTLNARLTVEYVGEPVLRAVEATPLRIRIQNASMDSLQGTLQVDPPAGLVVDVGETPLIAAGDSAWVGLIVRRSSKSGWVADKNLFKARFRSASGAVSEVTFGLGGARQWQVYGPYWDMWDKSRDAVCPYHNEHLVCLPGMAGFEGDHYNHYVSIDAPYLDEVRLHEQDLPFELPFWVERGEEPITEQHVGGFRGQACYYFVRTFQCAIAEDAKLMIGRSGPCRIWLDGIEVFSRFEMRQWAVQDEMVSIRLTGQPQRLVVKFARLTDTFTFSAVLLRPPPWRGRRGVSYVRDDIADYVPASNHEHDHMASAGASGASADGDLSQSRDADPEYETSDG